MPLTVHASAASLHVRRIAYRSMERSLTDEEINELQESVRTQLTDSLKVELR